MDIDLLSRMVGELIVRHDQVGLPGVGTFVAELVPASFSDKGFTINPPYRRLSFYPSRLEDTLLIDLYASSNQIPREAAKAYITQYLAELKSVLEERKSIVLPGLGRLRATRENALFFVPEEGLDIYPAGVGLRPVSLKSHDLEEEPVVINVPAPAIRAVPEPISEPAPEVAVPPVIEPESLSSQETPGGIEVPENEEIPDLRATSERPEDSEETEYQEVAENSENQDPAANPDSADNPNPSETSETPAPPERKGMSGWLVTLLVLLCLAAAAFAAFMVLSRLAPDITDKLLYTPEELRIINY